MLLTLAFLSPHDLFRMVWLSKEWYGKNRTTLRRIGMSNWKLNIVQAMERASCHEVIKWDKMVGVGISGGCVASCFYGDRNYNDIDVMRNNLTLSNHDITFESTENTIEQYSDGNAEELYSSVYFNAPGNETSFNVINEKNTDWFDFIHLMVTYFPNTRKFKLKGETMCCLMNNWLDGHVEKDKRVLKYINRGMKLYEHSRVMLNYRCRCQLIRSQEDVVSYITMSHIACSQPRGSIKQCHNRVSGLATSKQDLIEKVIRFKLAVVRTNSINNW
jgi:hypothetical protein